MAEIVRIVVASPGDVLAERDAVERVCGELNRSFGRPPFNVYLQCDRWEKAARPGMHKDGPQGRVDEALQIPECDILLGLLWTRFGTPVKDAESGTEHEFNLAYEAWKKRGTPDVWFYFKEKGVFFKTEQETKQYAKVQRFRRRFPPEGMYWPFQETEDFERAVRGHLTDFLTERYAPRPEPAESQPPASGVYAAIGGGVSGQAAIGSNINLSSHVHHHTHLGAGDAGSIGLTGSALDNIRKIYLDYLIRQHARIDPRGIPQTESELSLPLDEVYVSLTVEREAEPSSLQAGRDLAARLGHEMGNQVKSEVRRIAIPVLGGAGLSIPSETRTEQIELPRAVQTNARMVVLGDPGAGKTTLLRFLSVRFAQASLDGAAIVTDREGNDYGLTRLPLFLRVADFADTYRRDASITLLDFLPAALGDLPVSPSERAVLVQDALGRGALILLDGLDEVGTTADRAEIARCIDSFVAGLDANNRVIVTSRVAGYQEARLGGAFTQVTMRDMDDTQIARFLQNWCRTCERFQQPTADPATIDRQARAESDNLRQSIAESEGVCRLAKNPLLLTILALVYRNIGRLPQRRVELYELTTRTLLRDWRMTQAQKGARTVEVERAKDLLRPLAYWMHANARTGLIGEKDVFDRLCKAYAEPLDMNPKHPDIKREVEEFLLLVREHTGLFVEGAPGRYGLMHLTFEEYFAALHVIADPVLAPELIRPFRHSPRWEEPIRLAIASERPIVAARIIRAAIWHTEGNGAGTGYVPSEYEEILRRDLFLAARCLADCAAIEPALAREVAAELVAICLNHDGKGEFEPLRQHAREALGALRISEVGSEAAPALLDALKDKDGDVRYAAAGALGTAGQGSEEAVRALVCALEDRHPDVRYAAAEALGTAAEGAEEAVHALVDALSDKDWCMRRAAAGALGRAGQGSEEALSALLVALKGENSNVRSAAAEALGRAGQGSEEALSALLAALKDEDSAIRSVEMGTAGQGSGEAVRALLAAFKDALKDEDWNVRYAIAVALGTAGQGSKEALGALLAALKDQEPSVRSAAAGALRNAEQGSEEALRALLVALKDQEPSVRSAAAGALWTAGPGSEEAVRALLDAFQDDEDWNVQYAAAWALGTAQGSEEALRALLAGLKGENAAVRSAAVGALGGTAGQGSEEALRALLDAVKDADWNTRLRAVGSLGTAGQRSEEALRALQDALQDADWNMQSAAAWALGRAGQGSQVAVRALRNALQDKEPNVRSAAARALGTAGQGSEEAVRALQDALNDKNSYVRRVAWESLSQVVAAREAA